MKEFLEKNQALLGQIILSSTIQYIDSKKFFFKG